MEKFFCECVFFLKRSKALLCLKQFMDGTCWMLRVWLTRSTSGGSETSSFSLPWICALFSVRRINLLLKSSPQKLWGSARSFLFYDIVLTEHTGLLWREWDNCCKWYVTVILSVELFIAHADSTQRETSQWRLRVCVCVYFAFCLYISVPQHSFKAQTT